MFKKTIRDIYRAKRQCLSSDEIDFLSEKIRDILFQKFDFSSIKTLHLFLPITSNNEVNTNIIIDKIKSDYPEITIIVPSMTASYHLQHYIITDNLGEALEE